MPDALSYAAEQLAPAPASTNFFDPADGQNVIARYANTALATSQSGAMADSADRLNQSRLGRLAESRANTRWDRDEQDYQARQEYKINRGNFLSDLAKIDPEAEDYETRRSELYASLPEEAQKDDAVHAIMAGKDAIANRRLANLQRDEDRRQAFDDRVKLQGIRLQNDPRLAVLSEEERAPHYNQTTGEWDVVGLTHAALEKERTNRIADDLTKKQNSAAVRAPSEAEKEERRIAAETITDPEAFTPHLPLLREKYPGLTDSDIRSTDPTEYAKAQMRDRDPLKWEMNAARRYPNIEDYVNQNGNGGRDLTEKQKQDRRRVWKLAQLDAPAEGTPAQPQAAPQTPPQTPPQADVRETRVLNGVTYVRRSDGQWGTFGK